MLLKLLDYRNNAIEKEIGDLNEITKISIEILSGDEVARVMYKDYSDAVVDSCPTGRLYGFVDGEYEIYDFRKEKSENLLFDDKFINRKTSYDWHEWD